jgi:acyl transferase domain-containing protein
MDDPLAIVGMACRLPGADNLTQYWQFLSEGRSAITEVPADRWSTGQYFSSDPHAADKTVSRWGGFLRDIDQFDPAYFGIPPAEAEIIDPQQRIFLEVGMEAIEDAGIRREDLKRSRTGVFVGASASEYGALDLVTASHIRAATATGGALSIIANRLSYSLDLTGPSLVVDTACSSSLVALHLACQSIAVGESDQVLVGGVSIVLSPTVAIALSKAGLMSPDGRCRPFDAAANGYVRSEGCGVIFIRRARDALASHDQIYALLRGTAVNHDGRTNSLMAPRASSQQSLLQAAYRAAGVDASEVDYIEAHAIGTPIGDAMEARALAAVMQMRAVEAEPCLIGSMKANIGHLEAASGIAGVIKTALALRHGQIPPTIDVTNPIALSRGIRLATHDVVGAYQRQPRVAGVSAFGFGGTNAHVVLSAHQGGARRGRPSTQRSRRIVPITARSRDGLMRWAAELAACFTAAQTEQDFDDFIYTLQARREHYPFRAAFLASDAVEAAASLLAIAEGRQPDNGSCSWQPLTTGASRAAFVFPRAAGLWLNQVGCLAQHHPIVANSLSDCEGALDAGGGKLLSMLRWQDGNIAIASHVSPVCLVAAQIGLLRLWRELGANCNVTIGEGAGELTASFAAGTLSLEQTVLAARRLDRSEDAGQRRDDGRCSDLSAGFATAVAEAAQAGVGTCIVIGSREAADAAVQAAARLAERAMRVLAIDDSTLEFDPQLDRIRCELFVQGHDATGSSVWPGDSATVHLPTRQWLHQPYWKLSAGSNWHGQRQALPDQARNAIQPRPDLAQNYIAPHSEVEQVIAAMWGEDLKFDRVGIDDSLFALGGDSMTATRVLSQVHSTYSVTIDRATAFKDFTVKRLAELVEAALIPRLLDMSDDEVNERLRELNSEEVPAFARDPTMFPIEHDKAPLG